MLNLDFSGVTKREPVEEGIYVLTIEEVEETTARSSGNPMLRVKFAIDGTENNKVFENYVLTEKALWKLQELLEALGYEVAALASFQLDPQELVGQQVQGKVVQEEHDGNIYNRVKKVYSLN